MQLIGTMRRLARLSSLLVSVLLLGPWACTPSTPRSDELGKALRRGITLLEAKDDRRFLEEFMIPYQRQRSMGDLSDEKVGHFRQVAAERLLRRLKEAEKVAPKVNDSRTEAAYPIEPELRLVRVDGIWRIAD